MRRHLILSLSLAVAALEASAGDVEVAFHLGRALPYYEQALRYADRNLGLPLGLSLRLDDAIALEARGGLSLAGAVTGFVAGPLAFEARIDRAEVEFDVAQASFDVVLAGGAPDPPALARFTAVGEVTSDALMPFSLNLKLRSSGAFRVYISGGVSYLPSWEFTATETLTLDRSIAGLSGASIRLVAGGTIDGGIGLNGGLGLEFGLGDHVSIVGEARGFVFEERELEWRLGSNAPSTAEQLLAAALLRTLDPVRLTPGFYQATVGVAIRF
jgi:hypothetical protein